MKKALRGSGGMLPRKFFENLHTVVAILVFFEQSLGKFCFSCINMFENGWWEGDASLTSPSPGSVPGQRSYSQSSHISSKMVPVFEVFLLFA